jgi:hypothetical protein
LELLGHGTALEVASDSGLTVFGENVVEYVATNVEIHNKSKI